MSGQALTQLSGEEDNSSTTKQSLFMKESRRVRLGSQPSIWKPKARTHYSISVDQPDRLSETWRVPAEHYEDTGKDHGCGSEFRRL